MDVRSARKVCVVGNDILTALFPREDPIGKEIRVGDVPMQIIGVIEKQGGGLFGDFGTDGQIIMPIKTFQSTMGSRRMNLRIDIKVSDVNHIEETKEEVISIMRTMRKVPLGKPNDFAINQQEAFKEMYDRTVGVVGIAGLMITALALFVGSIGIMNIMFVSVTERTREIGVRKAIGAKTWSILTQFLAEAIIICLLGGVIGLMISFPLSLVINQFLPTSMPLDIVIVALLISAMVGIISGFLPAYKASKLDPVEALRYE
jgi:putative ABC transport system permease protein